MLVSGGGVVVYRCELGELVVGLERFGCVVLGFLSVPCTAELGVCLVLMLNLLGGLNKLSLEFCWGRGIGVGF